MKTNKNKIGIIGFGNMMDALVSRMLAAKTLQKNQLLVSQHRKAHDQKLQKNYGLKFASLQTVCQNSSIWFLGVKPQQMAEVLTLCQPYYQNQVIWTMAAGLELAFYQKLLGQNCRVIRLLPNTPTRLGLGVTAFHTSRNVSKAQKSMFTKSMSPTGLVTEVTAEAWLHSIVALSASGPAFVFEFIQSLAAAAQKLGLPQTLATKLALQTVLGASSLLAASQLTTHEQIAKVTSRKGTTEAGLKTLKEKKFSSIVFECLQSAKSRSVALAKNKS